MDLWGGGGMYRREAICCGCLVKLGFGLAWFGSDKSDGESFPEHQSLCIYIPHGGAGWGTDIFLYVDSALFEQFALPYAD